MKKIASMLPVILVLILTYLLATIFWLVFTPKSSDNNPVTATQTNLATVVIANDIFGNKEIRTKKPIVKEVKKSKLNLDLIGVLYKREKSFAIIAPLGSPKRAKNYRVGDDVKTGVKLHQVGRDFVLLQRRGGKLEKLLLVKKKDKRTLFSRGKVNKITQKSQLDFVQKQQLNDYRDQVVDNPRQLLSVVSLVPFFSNGKMQGIKVKPNKKRKLFYALGLKAGDIITKVNQIRTNNFSNFGTIRELIHSNTRFNLEIKRGNEIIILEVSL
jgi:type II secretion system protein C